MSRWNQRARSWIEWSGRCLFLKAGVCLLGWTQLSCTAQILPPRLPFDDTPQPVTQPQTQPSLLPSTLETERQWPPWRMSWGQSNQADVGVGRFWGRGEEAGQLEEEERDGQRSTREPLLKVGQMGNLRSARRFEMETRPTLFNQRLQIFPESSDGSEQWGLTKNDQEINRGLKSGSNRGLIGRFRSDGSGGTASWFGEQNQNLRQRSQESWNNWTRSTSGAATGTEQDALNGNESNRRRLFRAFPQRNQEAPVPRLTERF